jgi:hypothetical protein
MMAYEINQEINYKSGWVIEFESGREIIVDEENYNLYRDTKDVSKDKAICEAHYFLLSDAIKRNPKIREYFIKKEIFEKLNLGRNDDQEKLICPKCKNNVIEFQKMLINGLCQICFQEEE